MNQLELTVAEKLRLFDSLVGSVLNYNASVWGYHEAKYIEQVHCKCLLRMLKVKQSTNIYVFYGEVGRYPMTIARELIMSKYWLKLLKSNNKLIVNIYRMLCDDANDNTTFSGLIWAYHIKTLLQSIGLGNVWYEQRANN